MKRHIDKFRRPALLLAPAVALLLAAGTAGAVEEASWGQVKQINQPPAPAAKKTKAKKDAALAARQAKKDARAEARAAKWLEDSGSFGPEGGTLKVGDKLGPGGKDDVRVLFIVPEGSLSPEASPVFITMSLEVSEDLSQMTLNFGPSGTEFNPPAKLKIKLGKETAEALGFQSMIGLHFSGDKVDEIPLRIEPGRKDVEVFLKVPGFSRYSLGGGMP